MDTNTIVERFGELTKEEPLSSITDDLILSDTVVLEALSPFFGYYDDAPLANKEPYLYFVLDACHSLSQVSRAVIEIRKSLTHPLYADMGNVLLDNQSLPVIRIKGIEKFCRIRHLQKLFIEAGISLKKSQKKYAKQMAIISLQKFLRLRDLGDGTYLDYDESSKGYFIINEYFAWDRFKRLTQEAKYDTGILYFDAAQAVIIENKKITDLVRVYRKDLALEKLRAIRDRYYKVVTQF